MIHHKVVQGSAEWLKVRSGIPSASCADKILAPKTLKLSSQATAYRNRLVAEHVLGTFFEEVKIWSSSMEEGIEREQEATDYFSLVTGLTVEECGFITDDDGRYGCSPDRIVSDGAPLEVKNPTAPVQVGRVLTGELPDEYRLQVYMQMWIMQAPHAWFLSFYPGLPELLVKVEPDLTVLAALHTALDQFCEDLDAAKARMMQLMQKGPSS